MTSVVWIHIFLARHYNFRDDRVSFEDSNLDNNYNHKSELMQHRICRGVLDISSSSLQQEKEEFVSPSFARPKKDQRKNGEKASAPAEHQKSRYSIHVMILNCASSA